MQTQSPPAYSALYATSFSHLPSTDAGALGSHEGQKLQIPSQVRPKALKKKASAWFSTLDLSRPHSASGATPNRHSHPGPNLTSEGPSAAELVVDGSSRSGQSSEVQNSLNSLLSQIDDDEAIADGLEATAEEEARQKISLYQPREGVVNIKKTWMYANSRLPPGMLPFRVYIETWHLICKAVAASSAAYEKPGPGEKEDYVKAHFRPTTKTMVLKTSHLDDKGLIVIAIRGSRLNVIDWLVNFNVAPARPVDFLEDDGNACHEGFLQVARDMVKLIANRLRQLLQEDPSRCASSILFTGHSAGGAVANLLYLHMLSRNVQESELARLNGAFKRVHCITFGAPPISLLPLQPRREARNKKNLFFSFANEGDPVIRADWAYMKSMAKLLAAPAPTVKPLSTHYLRERVSVARLKSDKTIPRVVAAPSWPIPNATLSNAGKLVLLRQSPENKSGTEAVSVTDDELRNVVFCDPAMHRMDLYQRRIEELASAAIIGRGS